jgi:hypothetical protein
MDIPLPPIGMLTLLGLNEIVKLAFVTCAVRDTVPENPGVLRRETVEVAFMPWGIEIVGGLIVKRKLPVVLWASLIVNGSTVPLTVNEPSAKVRSRSRALRGTRFLDRVVTHSSELNP